MLFREFCLLLLVLSVCTANGLKWTDSSLAHDAYITACVGDMVNLTWDFQPPGNDDVHSIYWSFGRNVTIASWIMGNFHIESPFSGHVTFVAPASLVVGSVRLRDSGTYRVEVKLSGEENTEQRSAFLAVAAPPVLQNGKLEVQQLWSKSGCDFQSQITLTCGHFLSTGFPPASVIWKDPAGQILHSTNFQDGVFYLDLPGLPIKGNYSCSIPCHSQAVSCLTVQMSLSEAVTVDLNEAAKSRPITCVQDMLMHKIRGDGELNRSEDQPVVLRNLSFTEGTPTTLNTAEEETLLQQQANRSNMGSPVEQTTGFVTSRMQQPAHQASSAEGIISAALQQMAELTEFRIDFNSTQQQLLAKVVHLEKTAQRMDKFQNLLVHLEKNTKESHINISRLETILEKNNLQLSSLQVELEKAQNANTLQQGIIDSLSRAVREQDRWSQNMSAVVREEMAELRSFHLHCTQQQKLLAESVQGLAEKLDLLLRTEQEQEEKNQIHIRSLREEVYSNMTQAINGINQQVATRMFQVDAKTEKLAAGLQEVKSTVRTNQDTVGRIENQHKSDHKQSAQNVQALTDRFTQMEHLQAQSKGHLNSLVKDFESLKRRHCLSGTLNLNPFEAPGVGGWRRMTRNVTFDRPFDAIPVVVIGFTHLDVDHKANTRANVISESVTPTGFSVAGAEWADTHIYAMHVSWMACS